jgi:hypothetical protein
MIAADAGFERYTIDALRKHLSTQPYELITKEKEF